MNESPRRLRESPLGLLVEVGRWDSISIAAGAAEKVLCGRKTEGAFSRDSAARYTTGAESGGMYACCTGVHRYKERPAIYALWPGTFHGASA